MTQRLVAMAAESWKDLDGYAVAHSMGRLMEMPISRFTNFVWWWATNGADQQGREKFERRLYMPPKGVAPTTGPWTAEAESGAFSALRQSLGT